MSIFVDYEFSSYTRFLELLTGDLFTVFTGCHFDETVFSSLGGDLHVIVDKERRELT